MHTYKNYLLTTVQLLPVLLPVGTTALGIVAMVLLVTNQFYLWALLCFGIPAVAGILWIAYAATASHVHSSRQREQIAVDVAVLIGVALWCGLNIPFSTQHVLTNRDPATYAVSGVWLMYHHSLQLTKPAGFSRLPTITAESLGFGTSTLHANQLYAQGSHFLPAILGFLGKILGVRAVFYGNVICGGIALLAFYSFARSILKPLWAGLATFALSVSLPFIYFSRDSYTEPLALMCIFSTLALLHYAVKSKRLDGWLLTGICAGTAALVRPDSYLSIAAFEAYVLLRLATAQPASRRSLTIQTVAFAVPVAALITLGWLDLTHLSSGYYQSLRHQILEQLALIILLALVSIPAILLSSYTHTLKRIHYIITHKIFSSTIVTAATVGFIALFVRALWLFGMASLGKENAILVQTYSDHTTILWLCWYIGPVLTAAGISMFLFGWKRTMHGKLHELTPLLFVLTADCALYLLNPRISPDQIWASRRFLPVIFPGFILLGTLAIQRLHQWNVGLPTTRRVMIGRCIPVAISLAIVLPILTSVPFWNTHALAEKTQIEDICHIVPRGDTILWVGQEGDFATEPTAALCGVQSISTNASGATLTALLPHLEQVAAAQHTQLYVGAKDREANLLPAVGQRQSTRMLTYVGLQHTYKKFPLHTVRYTLSIVFIKIVASPTTTP